MKSPTNFLNHDTHFHRSGGKLILRTSASMLSLSDKDCCLQDKLICSSTFSSGVHNNFVAKNYSHLIRLGNKAITSKECLIHYTLISEAVALGQVSKGHILWRWEFCFSRRHVASTICTIKGIIIIIATILLRKNCYYNNKMWYSFQYTRS